MRTIFIVFLAIVCQYTKAATYYFSSSLGNDSRTAAEAQNAGTPWRTLTKLNSVLPTLRSGDVVLFRKGDTWYGKISIKAVSSITFGAYGSGAIPIISGATAINSWVNVKTNIYESSTPVSTLGSIHMLSVNDVQHAMGRYPNPKSTNGGYLTIDSHVSDSILYDADMPSSLMNWTGAQLVAKVARWWMDTSVIEAHSGNRIDVTSAKISSALKDGFGYFIQNHPQTLDQHGEWYYDPRTKKLRIYLASSPANYTIKASSVTDLVVINSGTNISFEDLQFEYANADAIRMSSSTGIQIKKCKFIFVGNRGIAARGSNNLISVSGSTFEEIGNYGMDFRGFLLDGTDGPKVTVSDNVIRKVGLLPGMGGFANGRSSGNRYGISVSGPGSLVERNILDSMGYIGIRFYGNNIVVKHNQVKYFCMTLDDGGAIYTYNGHFPAGVVLKGQQVLYNIIHDGIGSPEGTNSSKRKVYGMYFDANSTGVEFAYNTIFNCASWGIYVHDSQKLNIHHNVMFNNSGEGGAMAQVMIMKNHLHPQEIREVTFKHNILVAKTANQGTIFFSNTEPDTAGKVNSDLNTFGKIDSNFYARPLDDNLTIWGKNLGLVTKTYSLASWQAAYIHDAHTKKSPKTYPVDANPDNFIRLFYNNTYSSKQYSLNGTYMDITGKTFEGSIDVQSFKSVVLLKISDAVNKPPTVSIMAPADSSRFYSTDTITLTASASDPENKLARVEFYAGNTLIGKDSVAPYTFSWKNIGVGTHKISALAVDDKNVKDTSNIITIFVRQPLQKPAVSIISPAANASYEASSDIQIKAEATDADGSIVRVEFYSGEKLVATDYTAPYEFEWNDVPPGSYSVFAKAVDNDSLSAISPSVSFSVNSPGNKVPVISISNTSGDSVLLMPQTLIISSDANDDDGNIVRVDFYNGDKYLGSDVSAPYTFEWSDIPAGEYSFKAKATDDDSATAFSNIIIITVLPNRKAPEVSIVDPVAGTSYSAPASVNINALASDEDGNVIKVEFYVSGILAGSDETAPYSFTWQGTSAGTYEITVKATDNDGLTANSSSVSITVAQQPPANKLPVVSITSPANDESLYAQKTIIITATASDQDGSVTRVKFFNGSALIGVVESAPYTFIWNSGQPGTYSIVARAYDNQGDSANSAVVTFNLYKGDGKPVVAITSPVNNQEISAPTSVTIAAQAQDEDGTINRVDFFAGTQFLGSDYFSPYEHTWNNVPKGIHSIVAKAFDNAGNSTPSAPVSIDVDSTEISSSDITMSPNPAKNRLKITCTKWTENGHAKISIVNSSGFVLRTIELDIANRMVNIDVSWLSTGIYYLQVTSSDITFSEMFMKI